MFGMRAWPTPVRLTHPDPESQLIVLSDSPRLLPPLIFLFAM